MPSFYPAVELRACVEDAIVVILVMHWSRDAVAEHAFCERWERIHGVVAQEGGCGGGIAFGPVVALRCSELVELVLGWNSGQKSEGNAQYLSCDRNDDSPPAMAP